MRKPVYLGGVAGGAFVTALSGMADVHAQEDSYFIRDRNISVVDRVQAYNRADGIRSGSFVLRPQLDIGAGWTSNVFALSDGVIPNLERFEDESALFAFIRPSIAGRSDWNRHEISFDGYVEVMGNERFDSESFVTAGASLGGIFEIDRSAEAFADVSFDHLREGRQVNNTFIIAEEPVQYDVARGTAGLRREFGRTRAEVRFDLAKYDFDDVVIVPFVVTDPATGLEREFAQGSGDQDFRDRASYRVAAEGGYAISPDTALIVRGQINRQEYDNRAANDIDRDSEGFKLAVGAEFDLTSLVRGEITLGYFEQNFDDPRFEDADGLGVDLGIEWFPTELTTLTLTASRDVEQSPFINAGGVVREEAVVQVDHELRRNIALYAYAGIGQDAYDDLNRTFDRRRAGLGGRFYMNDNLSVALDYDYIEQDIDDDRDTLGAFGAPYDAHRAMVTVTLVP